MNDKDERPQRVFRIDQSKRVETGGLQFENDVPGFFIRGDDCMDLILAYGVILRSDHFIAHKPGFRSFFKHYRLLTPEEHEKNLKIFLYERLWELFMKMSAETRANRSRMNEEPL